MQPSIPRRPECHDQRQECSVELNFFARQPTTYLNFTNIVSFSIVPHLHVPSYCYNEQYRWLHLLGLSEVRFYPYKYDLSHDLFVYVYIYLNICHMREASPAISNWINKNYKKGILKTNSEHEWATHVKAGRGLHPPHAFLHFHHLHLRTLWMLVVCT